MNVLVITSWKYRDGLIQAGVLPYLDQIQNVTNEKIHFFIITMESELSGLTSDQTEITIIPWKLTVFGFRSLLYYSYKLFGIIKLIFSKRIPIIHAFCTPAGSIGIILSMLTGRELIVDSYEPHADPMVEAGNWEQQGWKHKLLLKFEKWQSQRAKYLLSVTSTVNEYVKERYHLDVADKILHRPLCVNLERFDLLDAKTKSKMRSQILGSEDEIVCIYVGQFGGLYYDFEIFRFFKRCEQYWHKKFKVILLSGIEDDDLKSYCNLSSLDYDLVTKKYVDHDEVPKYLGIADFAISPLKPLESRLYCNPIKHGEYWAMGLPILLAENISIDSEIIKKSNLGVVVSGFDDEDRELDLAIKEMDVLLKKIDVGATRREEIRQLAITHRNFAISERSYSKVYS